MEIESVDPRVDPTWDDMVGSFAKATIFHSSSWCRVLCESYGYTPLYLRVREGQNTTAILPLMEVRSWFNRVRAVSLPFSDECSSLGYQSSDVDPLIAAATRLGKNRRWRSLELRGTTSSETVPATRYYTHEVDLRVDGDQAIARCAVRARRGATKAARAGIRVVWSQSREHMRDFYRLQCETRRRHGAPPQPRTFFDKLQRHVLATGGGTVALAFLKGRPIAGAVFLLFGKNVLYKYAASAGAYDALNGNSLVMCEALRRFSGHGFDSLNLGRTSHSNLGLRQYKLGWGAREATLTYSSVRLLSSSAAELRDHSRGWPQPIFRAMPSLVARIFSRALYRHFA